VVSPEQLLDVIIKFTENDAEGGKRAQAIVAGLLDVFASPERVESGRINDPSRRYPGDVCIRSAPGSHSFEKAFEVRGKDVTETDVQIFGKKCADMGVREAALVMVSAQQPVLDGNQLERWAEGFGLGLTLFLGWETFIEQVLFWSNPPKPIAATLAIQRIRAQLIKVECSPETVDLWTKLSKKA
jgi:hypothetical protein